MWIWTCRPGFEPDLTEELTRRGRALSPRIVAPSLVGSEDRPAEWPVFARAGLPLFAETLATPEQVAATLAAALEAAMAKKRGPWALLSWVPDADASNVHAPLAARLKESVVRILESAHPDLASRRLESLTDLSTYGGLAAQVCVVSPERALVGAVDAGVLPTLAPGGRARSWMPKSSPSRAARKLVEALDWLGRGPEPGEVCVDLGAAPGGWTVVALERRARVICVDPANLSPDLRNRKGVRHVKASAFDFEPDEPVDWLLCDMAWRPLEVAALLAKWARRQWADALVSNVKLPMRQRVEFVDRALETVRDGGWKGVRARQLYHDREEITLAGWRAG